MDKRRECPQPNSRPVNSYTSRQCVSIPNRYDAKTIHATGIRQQVEFCMNTARDQPCHKEARQQQSRPAKPPISVLKKCFASGSEGFRSQGRQQNVSESGDSLEFCERTMGAKAPLQGQMTFSTSCYTQSNAPQADIDRHTSPDTMQRNDKSRTARKARMTAVHNHDPQEIIHAAPDRNRPEASGLSKS